MAMAMVQCLHGDEISCQGRDHSVVSSLSYKRGLCGPNGLGNGRSSEKAAGAVASDGLSHEGAAAERAEGGENSDAPPGKLEFAHGLPAPRGTAAAADRDHSLVGRVST